MLKEKYIGREAGRIPLPKNEQQLWSHHKYSVLARTPALYQKTGRAISRSAMTFDELATLLVETLREPPTTGGLRNALQHMWGYVAGSPVQGKAGVNDLPLNKLMAEIQKRAIANNVSYLKSSTALSELMAWL